MSKSACRNANVILGGVNVSDYVTGWSVGAIIGEANMAVVVLVDDPDVVTIDYRPDYPRIARNDTIKVKGVDISSHVAKWARIAVAGEVATVKLYLYADPDILTINGTHPWEYAS